MRKVERLPTRDCEASYGPGTYSGGEEVIYHSERCVMLNTNNLPYYILYNCCKVWVLVRASSCNTCSYHWLWIITWIGSFRFWNSVTSLTSKFSTLPELCSADVDVAVVVIMTTTRIITSPFFILFVVSINSNDNNKNSSLMMIVAFKKQT